MSGYSGAQGRRADIYVGVDVFARGKVVGGMFETNKVRRSGQGYHLYQHEAPVVIRSPTPSWFACLQALEIIRKHNFSAAIFAPGWVYEAHDDKSEFRKNQDK